MNKVLIIAIGLLYCCFSFAKSSYQVDLILFAYPQSASGTNELSLSSPLIPVAPNVLILKTNKTNNLPYTLLPASVSKLRDEYYRISHQSHYHVIGRYSWRQPEHSQRTVALPETDNNGWHIQGTVSVTQQRYYALKANLQCSRPDAPQTYFTVLQKQRLKSNTLYFLDHPQIGLLVKITEIIPNSR